ncbi:IclR family transcriptional regulator [Microbacterium sp. RD1]|uniref:IclR family transcriptional regulator n=1 Tax=Microbacterium sp. RD1 TaxID=3457313 RepID=UPI003FA533BD
MSVDDVVGTEPAETRLDVDRGGIQSIDRAANVLALLDQHTMTLTPAIVAERLGLNRTTAHRYLQSLQGAGFLSASYGPGPLLDQLSALVSVRQQILGLAPAILRRLADQTKLTCVLSFLGRSGAVVTLVEEASEGAVVLTVRVGTVLEPRAAQTRVLLAFSSDPQAVTRMHASLSPSRTREEELALAHARRDRIAWADLGQVGLSSVAVPIFGRHDVEAAMAMLGTTAMLEPGDSRAERVRALQSAATTLSSLLAK